MTDKHASYGIENIPEKTYIMDLKGGKMRRITVPADWKVTFGPLIPGERNGGHGTLALRFYEGKDQQRAIFTDVIAFRDSSIPIEEKVTKTKQKIVNKDAPRGTKQMMVEARITEWRNPDTPEDDNDDTEFLTFTEEVASEEQF